MAPVGRFGGGSARVIRPKDPDRERKLRVLRTLLKGLPAGETAVFVDEVDVNLNPKVGCLWKSHGGAPGADRGLAPVRGPSVT